MGNNKKKVFGGIEIIYNNLGQIFFKKRFILKDVVKFYRYICKGT